MVAPTTHNLFADLPSACNGEVVQTLLGGAGVRLERIVSYGQASPDGFWYDQAEDEWVVVLSGRARLAIENEREERCLQPGDAVLIPAHCRHRVTWTDPAQPTVWLALFFDASIGMMPVG